MPGTILKNVVSFTGLVIGVPANIAHQLNVNGIPVIPQLVAANADGFTVAANTINVTVTRTVDAAADSVDVYVEHWHTIESVFPPGGLNPPKVPFVISGSGLTSPFIPPYPLNAPVITTIFVRLSGSDTQGTGTLANPFRTFQRAIRDVPHVIPPGFEVVIDVTGIGVETFPAGYQMPEIHGPVQLWSAGNPATLPFIFSASLNVRAFPRPASNIPLADTSIPSGAYAVTANPDTNLAIVTLTGPARASWAGDALKGKFLIGSITADTSCVIYGSDSTHLFLCNTADVIVGDLTVSETSATFQSPAAGADNAGFECVDMTSVAFQGITFRCLDPASRGLLITKTLVPCVELCDMDGLASDAVLQVFNLVSSVIRDKTIDIDTSCFVPLRTLFLDLTGIDITLNAVLGFINVVFDDPEDFIGPPGILTAEGAVISQSWAFVNCLIKDSASTEAAIFMRGGNWSLENVHIQGSTSDAILAAGLTTVALNHVTGGTGAVDDPVNGGFGVRVQDGASVRIVDDATLVTGTLGDMKVGTLPIRSGSVVPGAGWTDFRTIAPIKNEYDLRTPFVAGTTGVVQPTGDEDTGVGSGGPSGSRLFQRAP